MALLYASHPRLVGVRTSYVYIFLIFPGHRVLGPIANPYLGPSLGCTLLQVHLNKLHIKMLMVILL